LNRLARAISPRSLPRSSVCIHMICQRALPWTQWVAVKRIWSG
jgi:hypothetical protein